MPHLLGWVYNNLKCKSLRKIWYRRLSDCLSKFISKFCVPHLINIFSVWLENHVSNLEYNFCFRTTSKQYVMSCLIYLQNILAVLLKEPQPPSFLQFNNKNTNL